MDEREQDYKDKLILLMTNRLKRYRALKLLMYVVAMPIMVPLVLLAILGEWSEALLGVIKKGLYEIRFQVVWRLRWNELARERHAATKKSS